MNKYVVRAEWSDVPHLTDEQILDMLASIPPYQLEARSKGLYTLGAGTIYPVAESVIYCEPFAIPAFWPKAAGMDVGWNRTAVVWGALDPEADVLYIYREHYLGQEIPSTHASAIRAADEWVNIAIDPASGGSSQVDGTRLIDLYRSQGLNLCKADNAVESGILEVWQRMVSSRLKIFSHLGNLKNEIRTYHRDKLGKVAPKQDDHACDALRYLVNTLNQVLSVSPEYDSYRDHQENLRLNQDNSGKSKVTGY